MNENNIVIYENQNGVHVEVKLEQETVWLTQAQIAMIFGVNTPAINKHIKNIYKDGELAENATVSKMEIVQTEGKRQISRNMDFYNLDMIISIGYRVNSKNATSFRVWATNVLKKYLVDGYAVNERRLTEYKDKFKALQQAVSVLERVAVNQVENLDPMVRELLNITAEFAAGFEILDSYDHEQLAAAGRTKREAVEISVSEFLAEIEKMKPRFGGLFGAPRDDSFESSVRQIYQSVGGRDAYPTIEEKAATLLYLVTKNHSFADGNKRIAAFCFVYFLARNRLLFANGAKIIDDGALAALTLLIAESKPTEMDTVKRVVVTMLNMGGGK
ncbi:MAG: virulence protein RhuM/Fic/DOC family protein [Rickettsiales bacterium]|jgi:prophage maintenance system killer protein/prophage antirepressor-like protein|nr:virulence protein RhuM/Fic/DOC family protein [Rickettsiales bacterium]